MDTGMGMFGRFNNKHITGITKQTSIPMPPLGGVRDYDPEE
jgi:hypothetical protein